MNKPKLSSIYLPLLAVAGFALSAVSSQAQSATATISDVTAVGGFDYTVTLKNTGSVNLNGFWYGWTIAGNNLPSSPSTAGNSLGWQNALDANSIMYFNSGTGTALTPGSTGTFTFFSISSPTAITTSPSGLSVAYVKMELPAIDASEGVSGDSTVAFAPVLVASPEPSSIALLAVGSLGLLAGGWRKLRARQ
jgi:hypothetical protein